MMNKIRLLGGLVASASFAMFAPSAQAYWVDFATSGVTGGIIQCAGGQCTGTNIPVNTLSWDNTGDGLQDGVITSLSLLLNFSTSANTITIGGTVGPVTSSTLLSGSFSSFGVAPFGTAIYFNGTGPDTKDAALLTYLGIPPTTQWIYGTFELAARLTTCPRGYTGTCYAVTSGDTLNTSVPEPGSLALLGLGLLGLGAARRRKA